MLFWHRVSAAELGGLGTIICKKKHSNIFIYIPMWQNFPWVAMKTNEKTSFLLLFLYFFGGNGIGFEKYVYRNGIGLRGSTETNQYGR